MQCNMIWQLLFGISLALLGKAHSRLRAPRAIPRPSLASSKHDEVFNGVQVLSWKPSADVKGAFLLLHGCGRHASDFHALPEESRITAAVLDRGFIVLAPDSSPSKPRCWDPVHDGPLIRDTLRDFLKSQHLQDKPLYGVGVSNGGSMLEYMFAVLNVNFAGLNFIVGPNVGPAWGLFKTKRHPPVAFVHMQRDPYTPPHEVRAAIAYLRQMHTPVQELEVAPLALGHLVAQAGKIDVGEPLLRNVVDKLVDWGYTTQMRPGEEHFLKVGVAQEAIKRLSKDPQLGTLAHNAAFEEELDLVEGWHCPTAEHIDQSLNFLLNETRIS